MSTASVAVLYKSEQEHAKEFHDLEKKIDEARKDNNTYDLGDLKDKREQKQKEYWTARKEREALQKTVAEKSQEQMTKAWNDQLNCFNIDNSMPLIHLKYRMPADINDATGTMFDTKKGQLTADSNLFFSGIYQVSKVESSIKNGAFTQILHMVRLNNQQGIGVAPFQNTNITDAFVQKNTDGGKNVYTDESMFGILDYDETSPLNEKQTEKMNNLGKKQFIEGKLPWELDK